MIPASLPEPPTWRQRMQWPPAWRGVARPLLRKADLEVELRALAGLVDLVIPWRDQAALVRLS